MNPTARAVTITVANQKGGVGKTTNAVHLAAALGQGGYRCLLIDLDPAAGATRHLGVPENRYAGTLELLCGTERLADLVLAEQLPRGVHLLASRPQLAELDTRLTRFTDRTRLLEQPLLEAQRLYDFIFLDTPPIAGATTTMAAYAASEWILLSAFPHPLSLAGLTEALNDIADVRQHRNPMLEVLGVVFTNVDPRVTRLRAAIDAALAAALPRRSFESSISQSILIPEASGAGKTLFQVRNYARIPAALQYLRLAAEIEQRVRNRESFLAGTLPPLAQARASTPHTVELNGEA